MVRQAAEALDIIGLNENVKNFEGFAYVSNRKPRHSHGKKPDNGDLEARSMAKVFLQYSFPVFECHSKVSQQYVAWLLILSATDHDMLCSVGVALIASIG
jgi:hypothetical protein